MKKFNYLFMSMLVSFIAFTACGDDDEETPADPTITVTESYSIEGARPLLRPRKFHHTWKSNCGER